MRGERGVEVCATAIGASRNALRSRMAKCGEIKHHLIAASEIILQGCYVTTPNCEKSRSRPAMREWIDASDPALHCRRRAQFGPVAQRLEQGTHNPLVGGSNPSGPTKLLCIYPGTLRRRERLQARSLSMIAGVIILAMQAAAQTQPAVPAVGAPLILRPAVLQQRYVERLRAPPSTLAAPWL